MPTLRIQFPTKARVSENGPSRGFAGRHSVFDVSNMKKQLVVELCDLCSISLGVTIPCQRQAEGFAALFHPGRIIQNAEFAAALEGDEVPVFAVCQPRG